MRLFTLDNSGTLIPFKEKVFQEDSKEADLEDILESNPEYFFENSNILIIGRQVTTNLNTFIDLLGVDVSGNVIIVELKRNKTPRETIAQILEYASFIEKLDYAQLDEIFKDYSGEEVSLDDYHQQYFQSEEKVSFNKITKLMIVAQKITKEIKQTAMYLRGNGIDISCLEFRYFTSTSDEKLISADMIVGVEEYIRQKVRSESLPKIDKHKFLKSLDEYGIKVFEEIFQFADQNDLFFIWGSKGFSLNVKLGEEHVALFFGYPPDCAYKQSVYTAFIEISRNINDADEIINLYKTFLDSLGLFQPSGKNFKWLIDKIFSDEDISSYLNIVKNVIDKIKEKGHVKNS